jgi:ABC-type multidrug transport system permease subunit
MARQILLGVFLAIVFFFFFWPIMYFVDPTRFAAETAICIFLAAIGFRLGFCAGKKR